MPSFKIQSGENLSLNILLAIQKAGGYVSRTGHLGNHYLSNLLIFCAGIWCHLFDRNRNGIDRNYWPEFILLGGEKLTLAEGKKVFVPLAKFHPELNGSQQFIGEAANPAQVHYRSMRQLFGNLVWTESQYLHARREKLAAMVNVLTAADATLFSRSLYAPDRKMEFPSGQAGQYFADANEFLTQRVEEMVADFPDWGIVPDVKVIMVLSAIMAWQETGQTEVWELSGPDMINYAFKDEFRKECERIYQILRANFPELPNELLFTVVPSFYFRFGSLTSERSEMDELWQNLTAHQAAEKTKAQRISALIDPQGGGAPRKEESGHFAEIIAEFHAEQNALGSQIRSSSVVKRICFEPKAGGFFSQYDLIASGEQLYVPEAAKALSFRELEKIYRRLERIMKKGR